MISFIYHLNKNAPINTGLSKHREALAVYQEAIKISFDV
jgi:hypothetical protein